jgi:hypothetical protein
VRKRCKGEKSGKKTYGGDVDLAATNLLTQGGEEEGGNRTCSVERKHTHLANDVCKGKRVRGKTRVSSGRGDGE